MIVDPARHVTELLAFAGIFAFAYIVGRSIYALSERRRPTASPVNSSAPPSGVKAPDHDH